MAFWGVHLEPGKSFTHRYDKHKGKLRISQATLGAGASVEMCAVQCTVGDKEPILLCAFLPSKKVSCPLDLEFEEEDDVVFKVTGPQSVYLAGYYVRNPWSEEVIITGNKIVEVGGDCGIHADRSTIHMAHVSDEGNRHLRKKRMMTEGQKSIENANTEDDGKQMSEPQESSAAHVSDEGYRHTRKNKKKKMTEAQSIIENANIEDEEKKMSESQESITVHASDEGNRHLRKKKKRSGAQKSIENANTEDEGNQISELQEIIKTANTENEGKKMSEPQGSIAADVSDVGIRHVRKKKKMTEAQKSIKNANTEDEEKKMTVLLQDSIENANKENEEKKMSEPQESIIFANTEDEEMKMSDPQESIKFANTEDEEKKMSEPQESIRTAKTEDEEKKMSEAQESITTAIKMNEEKKISLTEVMKEVIPLQERSFRNGLVIMDLEYGKGNSEGAGPGCRVTVNYVSYRNGRIVDSRLNGSFKFRLGSRKVIMGLDVGINGMRVGDKRRLTIPPSMTTDGKGGFAADEENSYLTCDVELVNIKFNLWSEDPSEGASRRELEEKAGTRT